MVYQGSKARLKKYIVPILQKCIDDNGVTNYVEPFVGGANIIDSVKCEHRIASDINKELISFLTYMQLNPELDIAPEDCSFEHYADVRENRKNKTNKYSETYTALIGYFASYGGRYFDGGYGRDSKGGRCIYKERLANAREQAPLTPLSSQVWNCVEVWNGGTKVFEAKNAKITVWTMHSSAGFFASSGNETNWIVYTIEYDGGSRNIIDSEALSIIFW